MPVTIAEIALLVLIFGLHFKYVYLWYGGSGGLKGYWRSRPRESMQKKLAKLSFGSAIIFALGAMLSTMDLLLMGLALLALLTHLLLLAFYRK